MDNKRDLGALKMNEKSGQALARNGYLPNKRAAKLWGSVINANHSGANARCEMP